MRVRWWRRSQIKEETGVAEKRRVMKRVDRGNSRTRKNAALLLKTKKVGSIGDFAINSVG